ncbi:hypothetical protein GTO27_11750 [Candidatus Bathyarchaeota archaeon]|nr:hypothetical protein [Candidatus Bathyarchaeota archaeon]
MPRLYLNPVVSVAMLGESFTVDLMVADVALLYGWQVNMSFNPSVLQFINVTEGPFLKDQPEGTWTVPPAVGYGWVLFGWMTEGPYLGVSGSGWLATVEFLVLNIGESILNIDDPLTKLFRYNPPPLPPGKEPIEPIPHTRENGYFFSISWEHIFEDERRDTMLKISTDDNYFQFIAPEKEFSVKHDPHMFSTDHRISISYEDSEIVLWSLAVVTPRRSFCVAIARDVETGTRYQLIDST